MRSKFFCAVIMILLSVSTVFASSPYEEHQKRFEAFSKSIDDAANKISWSGEYNLQDVEFVRNEMNGDETVYARAWYSDYYVVIRHYKDNNWSSSYVSEFWTTSEELTFINGIKVGSPFSAVESYFGKEHFYGSSQKIRYVQQEEETDFGGVLMFSVEDGKIEAIGYLIVDENYTSKMSFLFDLYSSLYMGEVTGDKVNVREYAPNGKVRFQVSKSKGDRLLVDVASVYANAEDWYPVAGRIVDNSLKTVPVYFISKQFVKTRKLTPSERKLFISQYRK